MRKFLILAMLTNSLCLYAQVGIKTSTPDLNSDLTLGSSDKGLLINRVALKAPSSTNPLSENAPAGMLVYNTQTTPDLSPGVYVYDGEDWGEVNVNTRSYGTKLTKIKYRGKPLDPPTLKIPEMNIEFRLYPDSNGENVLEMRLLTPPAGEVVYTSSMLNRMLSDHEPKKSIFTPQNYNIWQTDLYSVYLKFFSGLMISTATGVIPGSSDLNIGVFYEFHLLDNTPDDELHLLSFHLY